MMLAAQAPRKLLIRRVHYGIGKYVRIDILFGGVNAKRKENVYIILNVIVIVIVIVIVNVIVNINLSTNVYVNVNANENV